VRQHNLIEQRDAKQLAPRAFYTPEEVNPMQDQYPRPHSPFDDTAIERLRRMGLVTAADGPDRDVMAVFSGVFAGQFYDDLCDYYQDYEDVRELLNQIFDAAENADPRQKFLLICLQYDGMFRDLPDPVWWVSGQTEFAERFADGFLAHLKRLAEEAKEESIP